MRAHDFGQFLLNSSIFDETQLVELISAAKNVRPTFATAAIFLRLLSVAEMVKVFEYSKIVEAENVAGFFRSHDEVTQEKYNEIVRKFLSPHKFKSISNAAKDNSFQLAQILIDGDKIDFSDFEKILESYHREEIPPVEKIFGDIYNAFKSDKKVDYPPALDVAVHFHSFFSEEFRTTAIFSPAAPDFREELFGASVKINGNIPIVVGVLAEKKVLHKLANSYDKFVSEDIEEDFDAVAEMLNVFTGNFTVRVATTSGIEEELYPPRFGQLNFEIETLATVFADVGKFYLYIGAEEIFKI